MMTNVYWPRRPDLCPKTCQKYEERTFKIIGPEGEAGYISIAGDYSIQWKIPGYSLEDVA